MVSSNSCGKIIDRAIVKNTPPSIVDLYYAACPVGNTACPLSIEPKLDGTTASITPRADRWKDAWADR